MSKTLFLVCCLALTSSLLADVKDVLTKNYRSIDLETDPTTRCLYIKCTVNGFAGSFLVDLSSPTTTLALERLEKFDLEKGDASGEDSLPDGSTTDRFLVPCEKLNIGNVRFNIKNLHASAQHGNGEPTKGADGRLGANVFKAITCVVDYPAKRFYFELKEPETTFASAMEEIDIMAVEMNENGPDRDIVAKLNGTDVHFLIDTGASESLIAKEHLKESGLTAAAPPEGSDLPFVTTLEDLKLGSVTFKKLPLRVVSMGRRKLDSPVRKIAGIIGSDLLSEAGVVIDYSNNTIYFPDIQLDGSALSNLPGAFPFGEKVVKRLKSGSESIFTGTLSESKNLEKIIKVGSEDYLVFGLAFTEKNSLKGNSKETQVVKVRFKRSLGDKGAQKLIDEKFAQENNGWIIFKNRKAILELDQTIFRDSALRRKALE
ncbi:MAG: aspartyl protease family protein [Akkermansiaceae bacterium]